MRPADGKHAGYCDVTRLHASDCTAGDQGAWRLSPSNSSGWAVALHACHDLCNACARCNFISASLLEAECGWFNACDLANLRKTSRAEWRTVRIRRPRHQPKAEIVSGVALRQIDVVPWAAPAGQTAPVYVVEDASMRWIAQENRGEALVRLAFRRLGAECSERRENQPRSAPQSRGRERGSGLVLDIGANSGYYGLTAAAYGCRVVAFEPQPGCHAAISAAIARNGFGARMRLERRPVGAPPSGGVTVRVPARGCWMTASATTDGPRAQASDAISALPLRGPGVASAYSLGVFYRRTPMRWSLCAPRQPRRR